MNKLGSVLISIETIERSLIPSDLLKDEEIARIVRPLAILSLLGGGLAIVYAVLWLFILPEQDERVVFPLLISSIAWLSLFLIRIRSVLLARSFFLASLWVIATIAMLTAGGTRSPSFTLYILIVMVAALLSGWRMAFFMASLTVLAGFATVLIDPNGILLVPFATPLSAWLTHASVMIVVTGVAYFIHHQTQQAFRQVQQALAERDKSQQELRESEARFRLISAVTSDFTFSTNVNAQGVLEHTMLTGAVERILGYTPSEFLELGGWLSILHPDDRKTYDEMLVTLSQNTRAAAEARIIRKDGELRWVRVYAHPVWDETANRLIGVNSGVQEITESKRAEFALVERESNMRRFREQLEVVHHISVELGMAESLETFCRMAVELGRERLGFDRVGLWLYDQKTQTSHGTFGTDTQGQTFDERHLHYPLAVATFGREIVSGERQLILYDPVPLASNAGEPMGEGWSAQAALWNGKTVIGYICVDNLINRQPVQTYQTELLTIYGTTVGSLYTRKLSELALRDSETRLSILNDVARDISALTDLTGTLKRVLKKLQAMLPLDLFFVALIEPDMRTLTYPIMYDDEQFWDQQPGILSQSSWISQVLMTKKPLLINRTLEEIQTDTNHKARVGNVSRVSASAMMAPLLIGDQNIGVISIQSYTLNNYNEHHIDLLVGAGYQIAIAVQNARLYDSLGNELAERKRLEDELQEYANKLELLVDERTNALRHAKEQFELILNSTTDALAFANPNGDILMTNPAFLTMFDQWATKSIEHLFSTTDDHRQAEILSNALLKVIYNSQKQQLEARIVSKEGREKDIDITLIPMNVDGSNGKNGVLLSGHDITQLKEVERFKTRFVEDAVHDLATPITGLSTRLYLLQRSPDNLTDHVRALENQVRHLRNLLEDLRTLSQLDHNQIALNVQAYHLDELLQRIFDTYEPVALNKQQTLLLDVDPTLPLVRIDPRQIERVMVNLVSNAINYTAEHKVIRIEASSTKSEVMVAVYDQGMGISSDDLPRIFERFYRTPEARKNVSGGTGLGLAISKEIVEMHGGAISVTSTPGQGSIFMVKLPI